MIKFTFINHKKCCICNHKEVALIRFWKEEERIYFFFNEPMDPENEIGCFANTISTMNHNYMHEIHMNDANKNQFDMCYRCIKARAYGKSSNPITYKKEEALRLNLLNRFSDLHKTKRFKKMQERLLNGKDFIESLYSK